MQPRIIVIHRKDGTVERYVLNAPGQQCQVATRPYQELDARHGAVADVETSDACEVTTVTERVNLQE